MKIFIERIQHAAAHGETLTIRGGGTKDFYGGPIRGQVLDTREHRGVIAYEPSELVITARAGTPLAEIEALLAEHNQMLAFEPPRFGASATLGGCVAAGLAGPARAYRGAVRDFVLGVSMIDGRGEVLHFGGQVMKNVAGFDVSRLMCGALGTLGVLTEISIKVLPRPAGETTLRFEMSNAEAVKKFNEWAGQPLPISATSAQGGVVHVRLSGAEPAIKAAQARMGGEVRDDAAAHWHSLREHTAEFFAHAGPLWRVSVPATTQATASAQLIEWGGALRWLTSDAPPAQVRAEAQRAGGTATLFRGGAREEAFPPLDPVSHKIQRKLQAAFDPHGVFNLARLLRP